MGVLSGKRIVSKTMKHLTNYNQKEIYNSTLEIDNHADTTCFGMNFKPLLYTGQVCQVSGFSDSLPTIDDVEVCQAATAYTDEETGITYILVVNQGLWFGDRMKQSLLNPNQVRHYGHRLSDNPFDKDRPFGIQTAQLFIPFTMQGSIALLKTRTPTDWELNNCKHIELTDPRQWDPNESLLEYGIGQKRKINSISQGNQEEIPDEILVSEIERVVAKMDSGLNPNEFARYITNTVNIRPEKRQKIMPLTTAQAMESETRHTAVTAEEIAKKWQIGLESAKATLKNTTQLAVRTSLHPLHKRYKNPMAWLRFNRLQVTVYTDTMFSRVKSTRGNTAAQVFSAGNFVYTVPIKSKANAGDALLQFIQDVGIPEVIVSDGAKEQTGANTKFMEVVRTYGIKTRQTEPYSPWQNRAENTIGRLKRRWRNVMTLKGVPIRLWDFGLQHQAELMSRIVSSEDQRPGVELLSGHATDISQWLDFEFYDRVWYLEKRKQDLTEDVKKMGRWLGVSHNVGADLCYWIINEHGDIMPHSTVQHITKDELAQENIAKMARAFDMVLEGKLRDANFRVEMKGTDMNYLDDEDEEDSEKTWNDIYPEADEYTPETFDEFINAEVISNDGMTTGTVWKRKRDEVTNLPMGRRDENPMLDTRRYEIRLGNGKVEEYTANLIAENMITQVGPDGVRHNVNFEIVGHKKDETAVTKDDAFYYDKHGKKLRRQTTKGWTFMVEWKHGGCTWVPLRVLKATNPVELAEYSIAHDVHDEPAFIWWVRDALNERDRIVSKVKSQSKYWSTTHKNGFRLPHSVEEAIKIDKLDNNADWRDAITKEMENVSVAFEEWDGTPEEARSNQHLIGYQEIGCHLVFDIKMDWSYKARFVAGGHTTEVPTSLTFSSVVGKDSVRICLLLANLNGLKVLMADIGNAYLNAPCREKIFFIAGPEFGKDQGKVMIVTKALYGLKTSGAAWRAYFAEFIGKKLGFKSTTADPDVWIKPAVKKDGTPYYQMLLVYVDDILCIAEEPDEIMKEIGKEFRLKDGAQEPTRYLGANLDKCIMPDDGRECWCMSANDYLKNAVDRVQKMLDEEGRKLATNKTTNRPFPQNYRPELDTSPELDDRMATRFMQLIGILRWSVEIGRLDIYTEISMLSQHQALPREGHLEAIYSIFAYIKKHPTAYIVFDEKEPPVEEERFKEFEWTDFYGESKEEIPADMPPPRGKEVLISCFVDADHAANKVTRRSHSGMLFFVNKAPIIWYSKRQNTVEASTYGSELIALKGAVQHNKSLRYKLRLFGVAIDGPTNVYCDNNSVVKVTQNPEAKAKHNDINFHYIRQAAANKEIRVAKEESDTNLSDFFTKLESTIKRMVLCGGFIWWKVDLVRKVMGNLLKS